MQIKLENEFLQVDIESRGAELYKIFSKEQGVDYLWNGDEKFWGYRAPTLFPIIGKTKNDAVVVNGKSYPMTKHGFARTSEFKGQKISAEAAEFSLEGNGEGFPFRFKLVVRYELKRRRLQATYQVEGEDGLVFSLGGHPAFSCPFRSAAEPCGEFEDYYLEFEHPEQAGVLPVLPNGFLGRTAAPFLNNESIIPLRHSLFENDALVFEGLKSTKVSLKYARGNNGILFDFAGFPMLGIWTKPGAGFLCLEPWHGHADYEDFNGELKDKDGVIVLGANEKFTASYGVEVL